MMRAAAMTARGGKGRRAGLQPHELAVVDAALAILDARLRTAGAAFVQPRMAKDFLRLRMSEREREAFGVMFLDQQHRLIAFEVLFEGTLAQTSVYPREIARRALELNAAALMLCHNHPSGNAEPSLEDELLTSKLRTALQAVDVHVLDHFVVGGRDVVSFVERGLL